MALGGVPTGIMKARLLESVAGIISSAGFMPLAFAVAARIGIRMFAVAVLLVNSERNVTEKQSVAMIASGGQSLKSARPVLPITFDKPEDLNPVARQMPPPNRIKTPHGISSAIFQLSKSAAFLAIAARNDEEQECGGNRDRHVVGFRNSKPS